MNELEFFVFRHGETAWNLERRFQGHTDIPLNNTGRAQAQALALKMRSCQLELILSSDLSRATETASIVAAQSGVAIVESEQLRETKLGDPEGMLRDDLILKYGAESWARWLSVKEEDLDFGYPNGETKRQQLLRIRSFLENFAAQNPQLQRVGISTHGGSMRRLVHSCASAPEEAVILPNCALYKLIYSRKTQAWIFAGAV